MKTTTRTGYSAAIDRIIRTNSGYWDGVNAKERGKYPVWAKGHIYRQTHPHDNLYGEGFWTGWYGDPAPPRAVINP